MDSTLSKEYLEHEVFNELNSYAKFYESLAFLIMGWIPNGLQSLINIDTYVYSSMHSTLRSIHDILIRGGINDAYALLRKYYDSTIINVYTNLYLEDNFNISNFVVTQIDNWRKGVDKLPEYRVISQYIRNSDKLKPISDLLFKDNTYKNIRDRCNNHTHYNRYYYHILNDGRLYFSNKIKFLDNFSYDLIHIFIQHLSYIFYLNDNYMSSRDFIDSLEFGETPDESLQYLVAPFIQEVFDTVIKAKRPDIAQVIKSKTSMQLI